MNTRFLAIYTLSRCLQRSCTLPFVAVLILTVVAPMRASVSVFLPAAEEIRLENGLRALVATNTKQNCITLRVQFASGTAMDAFGKEGSNALAVHMLAEQIQMKLSTQTSVSVGTDASSFAVSVPSASFPQLFASLANIFIQPKLRTSSRHLLQSALTSVSDSGLVPTEPLANRVVYGIDHPYARLTTPERLQKLTDTDIQTACKTFCVPNNTVFYCTGNIKAKTFASLLKKTLGMWQSGEAPYLPRPRSLPQENGVYAMEVPTDNQYFRAGGAKPRIALAFDAPMLNDRDYDAYVLAARILEQRLKSSLPTDIALRIAVSRHKFANLLLVEQNITSVQALKERCEIVRKAIATLIETPPSNSEVQEHKKQALDGFKRSLRNPETLTAILAEADACGIPQKEVRLYPQRLQSLSSEAIHLAAKRYFQPERGMIVLGDSLTIALHTPSLQTFGRLTRYKQDGEEILNLDPSDITWETLLSRHQEALGGTTATAVITSLTMLTQTQLSAMAQRFSGTIITKQKAPGKITRKLEIAATQIVQELWCDGHTAFDKIEMMGQEQPLKQRDTKETESALFDAQIFPALTMRQCGFTAEILGKLNGNYVVKASTTNGTVKTLSFDATTYLLTTIEELRQTPQGIIKSVQEFREYGAFSGVKLPTTIVLKTGPGILVGKSTYEINPPLDDAIFIAPK